MADEKKLYKEVAKNLESKSLEINQLSVRKLSKPDQTLEEEVTKIYKQARRHRSLLVYFYVLYTIIFTIFVLALIHWQGEVRVKWHNPDFEVVPQGGLNLLLTGMFAQFIGLLTIVTKRVWDYKPFLDHHDRVKGLMSPSSQEPGSEDED